MKAVITVTGRDSKGIIAKVSAECTKYGGNIVDISQSVLSEYFAMIMLADVSDLDGSVRRVCRPALPLGEENGLHIDTMHEDIFNSMHTNLKRRTHPMINTNDILETIRMIHDENLDIRTITMGISLLDCASERHRTAAATRSTTRSPQAPKKLVASRRGHRTANTASRSSTSASPSRRSPWSAAQLAAEGYVQAAPRRSTARRNDVGVNFIGGFSALVQKGFTRGRPAADRVHPARRWPRPTTSARRSTSARPRPASTWTPSRMMGADRQGGRGADRATATASAARSWWYSATRRRTTRLWRARSTASGEADCVINVGVSGPGVVRSGASLRRATAT